MAFQGFASESSRVSSVEKMAVVESLSIQTGISKLILDNFSHVELLDIKKDITKDPWKYWDRQRGFTVNTLDKCAIKNDIPNYPEATSRLCALYQECLAACTYDAGHSYTFEYIFARYLRNFPKDRRAEVEATLKEKQLINIYKEKIYNMPLVHAESQIAQMIMSLLKNKIDLPYNKGKVEDYDILEPEQKDVVDSITTENFLVMTGYPGTGKTKTISVIARKFVDVLLVAPTGKAARRITEMCGIEARTVHSIVFTLANSGELINDCLIIIDEASMLDIDIGGKFFSLINPETCKVLIVGDTCQLPSVGPGQMLRDIIESEMCGEVYKHVHLTKIKRQEPGSIVLSAHSIAAGQDLVRGPDKRVQTFITNGKTMPEVIEMAVTSGKWDGAQYLTVLREKCADIINPIIQNFVNPGTGKWRLGDKVIHLKNDRERNVMNGDMGIIVDVNKFGFLARYANAEYFYTNATQWMVSLAYAFTVHKSQGSEFDKVILFLNKSRITNRNILYTGLTRAVNQVLIIADDEDVIYDAIDNMEEPRHTTIRMWLRKFAKELIDGTPA